MILSKTCDVDFWSKNVWKFKKFTKNDFVKKKYSHQYFGSKNDKFKK